MTGERNGKGSKLNTLKNNSESRCVYVACKYGFVLVCTDVSRSNRSQKINKDKAAVVMSH